MSTQKFDNLDMGSIRAIMLARGICQEHGFAEVDSNQLVIGLMEEGGDAARVLSAAGVKGGELRERVLKFIGSGGKKPGIDVPLSERVQAILKSAERSAQLEGVEVGTLHILQALLNQQPLALTVLLSVLGVTPGDISYLLAKESKGELSASVESTGDDATVKPSIIPSASSKAKSGKAKPEPKREAASKRDPEAEQMSDAERQRLKNQLLSEPVQEILKLATEGAIQLKSDCVGTEHVLVALLEDERTLAFKTLKRLGVTLEDAKELIEKLGGSVNRTAPRPAEIEFSAHVSSALLFANSEMQMGEQRKLEPEHLLLGIATETEGLASKVLKAMDLDLNAIRRAVVNSRDSDSIQTLERRSGPLVLSDRQYMKASAEPEAMPTTLKGMSADAKKVIVDAAYEAVTHGATAIGDEHILLGLLSQSSGFSRSVFDSICLELNMVRNKALNLERKPYSITWTGLPSSWNISIPLAKDTKALIVRGRALARNFRSSQLRPEHLLLAILELQEGRAIRTLQSADVNVEHLRKLVGERLGQKSGKG